MNYIIPLQQEQCPTSIFVCQASVHVHKQPSAIRRNNILHLIILYDNYNYLSYRMSSFSLAHLYIIGHSVPQIHEREFM